MTRTAPLDPLSWCFAANVNAALLDRAKLVRARVRVLVLGGDRRRVPGTALAAGLSLTPTTMTSQSKYDRREGGRKPLEDGVTQIQVCLQQGGCTGLLSDRATSWWRKQVPVDITVAVAKKTTRWLTLRLPRSDAVARAGYGLSRQVDKGGA